MSPVEIVLDIGGAGVVAGGGVGYPATDWGEMVEVEDRVAGRDFPDIEAEGTGADGAFCVGEKELFGIETVR